MAYLLALALLTAILLWMVLRILEPTARYSTALAVVAFLIVILLGLLGYF